MIEVPSSADNESNSNVLAVQTYSGLHLEPPQTLNVIEVDGDVEPVTKEEEVVTKKKTELTTTRQIETRVKRQIVLEDGKVIEDSGPIVETNTTEDTNKQESESVERLKPGEDDVDGPKAIEHFPSDKDQTVIEYVGDDSKYGIDESAPTVLAPRDGLVREMKTKKVVSREEIQERTETEDVKHLGDFSDEAYVNAVNNGVEIQELLSPEAQKQLIPTGPRLIHHSTKARKIIDTEDTDLKCSAQPDGTLVTEKRQTTEHEEFHDDELPEADDHSTGSRERVEHKESSQRFSKRRDEQEVEYVADGKTIGKEMRYLAETEDIERSGPKEDASDWDSLSDRVRKARRQQKTLLQQHREAFLERERKDRAIDFEKEEETRKDETIKWLQSHFGSSDGRSPDSTEEESEKKESFFNVTIKSNHASPVSADEPLPTLSNGVYHSNIKPKEAPKPQKYFQGITGWSERKETTPRKFSTKTFQDELKGTLERNRLRHVSSREDLIANRYKEDIVKSDDDTRKKNIKTDNRYGSRGDLKTQKEDLGYMSGSRTDIRPRHDSKEDLYAKSKKQQSSYLHREDSGYVKGSTEDLRYIRNTPMREDSFIRDSGEEEKLYKDPVKYNTSTIQRDDSAYVSSSTYFTEPRSPKTVPLCTPDSGIRSPTPEAYDPDLVRPTVPQRKREKKMRIIETTPRDFEPTHREPAPDYSPPNRSRSISPVPSPTTHYRSNPKKMYQKTRFASSSELSRPISTHTIETQTTPIKKNTVGATISNSLRKLVGKIRSASVDRKSKTKAKQPLSPQNSKQSVKHQQQQQQQQQQPFGRVNGGSTYQQYNVIDNHIGQTSLSTAPLSSNRDSSIVSSRRGGGERTIDRRNLSENKTMTAAVDKPKYYLGENPYLGSIYGKENKYEGTQRAQRYQSQRQRSEDVDVYSPNRHQSSNSANTLGRFSKSTNRLQTSPSHLDYDYRSAQTLPRKLEHKPMHSSAINIAIVNNARSPSTSQGPQKPARTYKSINRSKSFNVHGLNGTNNPSPIYMEKLNRSNISHHYRSNPHLNEDKTQLRSPSIVNLISRSQRDLSKIDENGFGSSNPISSSTYDVRRNGYHRNYSPNHYSKNIPVDRRAHSLLRTTSDNYRTQMDSSPHHNGHYKYGLERNLQRERESSLGSRSPLTINKDTAAIIRRNSSSTEDYSETYKTTSRSDDPYRPSITNTVHNFTKKTHPSKNGRGPETIETSERKSVTTSRYRNGDYASNNLRYVPDREIRKNSASPVVIEVRRK
ncbi:uncharacterized protein LOC116344908 isoform X2 [Contarinia nasturtii]|uniref:uncharacterized protein LOC116344908 isoform X2 n=1 Tax=Contarinia nasturtii TaxID=265458 RepID=UPI0012D394C5|nr:uncharacterized protein LOC116344908 isoform X2 [Contarinia nasturtii]XP_031629630.1 uncharacterized protein LOC116344908 isoform X2 [Contarinia nasturtii]